MTTDERAVRHQLARVADRLAWLTRELNRVQAQHDLLVRELCDIDGAHDRRPVAVR